MAEKINPEKLMDEIVFVQNQINGLQMLLVNKKQTMAKFFEKSGKNSISNDECTVYVQERTTVEYDVDKLQETFPKEITKQFIEKEYIANWERLVEYFKEHGVPASEIKQFFTVKKTVNKDKLSKLYDHGTISVTDMEGCYTAKVTKSVALKLKNTKQEINLT